MGPSRTCAMQGTESAAEREPLEVALDAATMGTWDWDLRAERVSWSPQLEAIHGFEPGALGSTLDVYFARVHPEDLERVRAGQYRWFLSHALPIRDDQGGILRWFGTNTDITERRL